MGAAEGTVDEAAVVVPTGMTEDFGKGERSREFTPVEGLRRSRLCFGGFK